MMRAAVFLALILLQACQSMPRGDVVTQSTPIQWTSAFPLEEVSRQDLQADECGLALWTRTKEAKRIFFAVNTRRWGVVNMEGQQTTLKASHQRASLVRGFSPSQSYAGSDLDIALTLEIETRTDVIDSAVVRSGVLTLGQPSSGKTLVVPVVGLIGCS